MTLRDFLNNQEWAVYKVSAAKRKFFGDTFFGPMWKDIPADVEVEEGLELTSLNEVHAYLGRN